MNDDIDHIVREFRKYYPVDGIISTSTVGEEDPKAPDHEQEMHCLWIGLHRNNKVKIPKRFRGFKIFSKLISKD
jgi:hypothetical protein